MFRLKGNGKPVPVISICSPFKVGDYVIFKGTNTVCEVTQIRINGLGKVDSVGYEAIKKNENGVPEMSGSSSFGNFIKEFAW